MFFLLSQICNNAIAINQRNAVRPSIRTAFWLAKVSLFSLFLCKETSNYSVTSDLP